MIEPIIAAKGVAIVGGVAGAAYLIGDYFMHKDSPDNTPLITRAAGAVVQTVMPGDVPAVKVGMPLYSAVDNDYSIVDSPVNTNAQLQGIAILCNQIVCDNRSVNGGKLLAAFASCESQTGSLKNACYNCSLFNVKWTSGVGYPSVRIGDSLYPSFRTGAASDVQGFRNCITHFKGFLERKGHWGQQAKNALMAGDPDAFQIAIGSMSYSPGYTNTITNGRITGSRFLQARLQRLIQAGLL